MISGTAKEAASKMVGMDVCGDFDTNDPNNEEGKAMTIGDDGVATKDNAGASWKQVDATPQDPHTFDKGKIDTGICQHRIGSEICGKGWDAAIHIAPQVDGVEAPKEIWLLRNEDGSLDDCWQASTSAGFVDIDIKYVRADTRADDVVELRNELNVADDTLEVQEGVIRELHERITALEAESKLLKDPCSAAGQHVCGSAETVEVQSLESALANQRERLAQIANYYSECDLAPKLVAEAALGYKLAAREIAAAIRAGKE